ncbi:MAG: OmpA family protein [Polyangiaceae bacterium]
MNKLAMAMLVAATVSAAACKKEEAKTASDTNTSDGTQSTKKDNSTKTKSDPNEVSNVKIDEKIIKLCGDLPTARFSFDSAEVSAEASNVLDALARCFISGPGKGKGIKLVGHADPRGETEYNLALGQRRAGSVGNFLQKKGVEQNRVATSSKGEFEATGTDESGWAADRKVEILLAD